MKKLICILILGLLVGCTREEPTQPIPKPNEELELKEELEIYRNIDYTDEDVINRGFYVLNNRGNIYNTETLTKFLIRETDSFTMVLYTDEGDMIISYIYYNGNNYHVIMDTTRDKYGWQGYYENEYTTLERESYHIFLKNRVDFLGNREKTLYNSIETYLIPNFILIN